VMVAAREGVEKVVAEKEEAETDLVEKVTAMVVVVTAGVVREAVAADSLARAVGDREVAAVGGVAAVARADLAAGADWAARRVARAGLG